MNDIAIKTEVASSPLAIIDRALNQGVAPEQLGQLLDLQERWTRERRREAYNRDMCQCQAELPTVLKTANNPHTRSKFARLEDLIQAMKPVYTRFGFSLSFGVEDCPIPEHVRIVCHVMHRDGHVEIFRADIPLDGAGAKGGKSSMNSTQATGSTYTYGQRYLIRMIFNCAIADEDNDGNWRSDHIGADQIQQINILMDKCREAGNPVDFDKFLSVFKIQGLERLPTQRFDEAIRLLNLKLTSAAKTEPKKEANNG
jgi:hypothetical protein